MDAEKWLAWRETERRKHRVMTTEEYRKWARHGDVLSHPGEPSAFPGGITIVLNADDPPFYGRTTD